MMMAEEAAGGGDREGIRMTDAYPALIAHWKHRQQMHAAVAAAAQYIFTPPPKAYHEELLELAADLLQRTHFELVVIVAQMACEVLTAQILDVLIERKSLAYLEKWIEDRTRNTNLGNDAVRQLYEALSGDQITTRSFWTKFKEHNERRNDVVHDAARVDSAKAQESLEACQALVLHLHTIL
jgi:hypothetical protein